MSVYSLSPALSPALSPSGSLYEVNLEGQELSDAGDDFSLRLRLAEFDLTEQGESRCPSRALSISSCKPSPVGNRSAIPTWIPTYNMLGDADVQNRPRVAVAWHESSPTYGPKIIELLKLTGASVQILDINLPEIDRINLILEVEKAILSIREERDEFTNIPLELLRRATPGSIVQRIYEIIEPQVANCEGLALLGGPNIPAAFYNPEIKLPGDENEFNVPDYRRTVAEIAAVIAAQKAGKAILGTCRGVQMLNVVHGGTLKDVEDQIGWQKLIPTIALEEGEEARLLSEGLIAFSCHGQACDAMAPGLRVVLEHRSVVEDEGVRKDQVVPKLVLGEKIVGVQFHPEESSYEDPSRYSQAIRVYELFYHFMSSNAARADSPPASSV